MAKKTTSKRGGSVVPLYGVVIHEAIAGGNLKKMKSTVTKAEKHMADYGNVAAALEALKIEIAKLEAGR